MGTFVCVRRPDRRAAGFTLVEVLVALAVLAVVLGATARVFWQGADLTASLRDRTMAMWVAQDRLTLHQVNHDWPDLDVSTGERTLGRWTWYWRESVFSTPEPSLRRIEVEVGRGADGDVLARLVGVLPKPE